MYRRYTRIHTYRVYGVRVYLIHAHTPGEQVSTESCVHCVCAPRTPNGFLIIPVARSTLSLRDVMEIFYDGKNTEPYWPRVYAYTTSAEVGRYTRSLTNPRCGRRRLYAVAITMTTTTSTPPPADRPVSSADEKHNTPYRQSQQ